MYIYSMEKYYLTKICLIAGSEHEAYNWARNQNLEKDQWFYAGDKNDVIFKTNFHVIVIGTPGLYIPHQFEKLYRTALERGKIGRL